MPIANGYTVGDDVALVIQTGSGPLNIAITEFESDPITMDFKSRPLGQPPIHDTTPDGHKGSFKVDRNSSAIDDFFAARDAGYWAGQTSLPNSIYQTIQEANGALTQYHYTKVSLKLAKGGNYVGDKKVEQTIEFMASEKVKVS